MRRRFLHRLTANRLALAGLAVVVLVLVLAVFAPLIAPRGYADGALPDAYAGPSSRFPFGSDALGRDILSRIIYGARVSLAVGVICATVAMAVGAAYGAVAGYYGGRVGEGMMRLVDLLYGLPTVLIVILLMVVFRFAAVSSIEPNAFVKAFVSLDRALGGVFFIVVGISIASWLSVARTVRSLVLELKGSQFIDAAHALGAGGPHIILRHLLPNFIGPVMVVGTASVPIFIMDEAFLSFIGLGVSPPTPSWGVMIADGYRALRSHPEVVLFPAAALSITLMAFNFLGDGLRDAFDPRSG